MSASAVVAEPWDMSPKPEEPPPRRRARAGADPTLTVQTPATPAARAVPGQLATIPLEELHESALNPRRTFHGLEELAESLRKGQLTPCLVRPRPKGGYELATGHRRYRAAKLAGLPSLCCVVQAMDETRFLEVLVIENDQREDVHPLEEAHGYAALMQSAGYDIARIAERVGRSIKYVYDRVKLLQLTKPAQQLFLDGRMSAGHAILLARLKPADQARAIASERSGNGRIGGLFIREWVDGLFAGEEADEAQKPVSVREFDRWIDENVRFDRTRPDVPELFPETAAVVRGAEEQREKVVSITYDYQVPDEARDEKERTYGPMSWRPADDQEHYTHADGTKKAKVCDRAVTGVIVVGPGRGEAFKVCIDKKHCRIHWPQAKKATSGGKPAREESWQQRQREEQERQRRQQAERVQKEARWKKATPAILAALATKVKAIPAKATGPLADIILRALRRGVALKGMARGSTAEDFIRYAALRVLADDATGWAAWERFPAQARALGVDVAKILGEVAPAPKADKAAARAKTAKGKKRAA